MQLDRTFIAIRSRGMLELMDLTLHVVWAYARPLATLWALGMLPWFMLNMALTYWMVTETNADEFYGLYFWINILLVASQAQVGTSLLTSFLGQAMFIGTPKIRDAIGSWWSAPRLYYVVHYLWRTVLLTIVLAFCMDLVVAEEEAVYVFASLFVPASVGVGLWVRAMRPFATEMILLERAPSKSADPATINYSTRSAALHRSVGGDSFSRFVVAVPLAAALAAALYASLLSIDGIMNLRGGALDGYEFIYWPLALWMSAGFVAVFRFLAYIDTRIRQEGWDVELRMRAEANTLKGIASFDDAPIAVEA